MNINIELIPDQYLTLAEEETLRRIQKAKDLLGNKLLVLGHHYQVDQIIQFADLQGDSLALAQKAAQNKQAKYIIFCGVHFMAESADILTSEDQKVILPDIDAGCSMADMANLFDVQEAWDTIHKITNTKMIPITYINSSADLKAFCGEKGGAVCTSSNAKKLVQWALEQGERLFFFPDQHLGRNTAFQLGIPLDQIIMWNPELTLGGNSENDIKKAKVILWYGFCSIHQMFKVEHIKLWRQKEPDIKVIVHPECSFDVVQLSDFNGSTSYIIKTIENSEPCTKWAVGTEINLVNRLSHQCSDKMVVSLSPFQCLCGTMFRIRPPYLLHVLERLLEGKVVNQVKVDEKVAHWSRVSLERMLSLS